jgi:hypothetical protein
VRVRQAVSRWRGAGELGRCEGNLGEVDIGLGNRDCCSAESGAVSEGGSISESSFVTKSSSNFEGGTGCSEARDEAGC